MGGLPPPRHQKRLALFCVTDLFQTTRGFDADLIFIDESEFVPEVLWTNTILPLNMQDKTSILAATTPQDTSTFQCHLINVKDPETGRKIFNVINLVEVCKSCLVSAKPWKCSHMAERISGSKSEAARKQTMLFYRPGQKHVMMRELLGQQSSESGGLIPAIWIERFHTSEMVPEDRPRAIYLGIDPGGGGPGELGVIAVAETMSMQYGPRLVVSFFIAFFFTSSLFLGLTAGEVGGVEVDRLYVPAHLRHRLD